MLLNPFVCLVCPQKKSRRLSHLERLRQQNSGRSIDLHNVLRMLFNRYSLSNPDGSKLFSVFIPVANIKCVVDRAARICIAMRNRTRAIRERETSVIGEIMAS